MFLLTLNSKIYTSLENAMPFWLRRTKEDIVSIINSLSVNAKVNKYNIEYYYFPFNDLTKFNIYIINEQFMNDLFRNLKDYKVTWPQFFDHDDFNEDLCIKYIVHEKLFTHLDTGVFPFGLFDGMQKLQDYLKKEKVELSRYKLYKFNNESYKSIDITNGRKGMHKFIYWKDFYVDYLRSKNTDSKEIIDKVYQFPEYNLKF